MGSLIDGELGQYRKCIRRSVPQYLPYFAPCSVYTCEETRAVVARIQVVFNVDASCGIWFKMYLDNARSEGAATVVLFILFGW